MIPLSPEKVTLSQPVLEATTQFAVDVDFVLQDMAYVLARSKGSRLFQADALKDGSVRREAMHWFARRDPVMDYLTWAGVLNCQTIPGRGYFYRVADQCH